MKEILILITPRRIISRMISLISMKILCTNKTRTIGAEEAAAGLEEAEEKAEETISTERSQRSGTEARISTVGAVEETGTEMIVRGEVTEEVAGAAEREAEITEMMTILSQGV